MMQADKDRYYRNCSLEYRNRAKMKRCRAAVHIEDENDKPFWSFVLNKYAPRYSFDFISYTRSSKNRASGSRICLKYKELGCLSDEFLIAIDSDERYLLQEKDNDAVHFVLQTYTYSIENHYCYPSTINQAFILKNKFNNASFDFDHFLTDFSKIIYPFYIYYLYSKKREDGIVEKTDFIRSWDIEPPMAIDIAANGANYLNHIKTVINEKLIIVEKRYPTVKFADMEVEFQALGLMPDNAYLYIRGHNLFEKLISSIVKQIYDKQINEYTVNFSPEEKAEYFNRTLNTNHEYCSQSLHYDYSEMKKTGEDIKVLF
jgi:hypothetical protein